MKQGLFESRHEAEWQTFDGLLQKLESSSSRKAATLPQCDQFPDLYRRLCHQYALACERAYGMALQQRLNNLVIRGHRQLYRFRKPLWASLLQLLAADFPRTVRAMWRWQLCSLAVFAGSLALVWVLVLQQPELVYSVIDEGTLETMEYLYEPGSEVHDQRDASDDVMMFGYYISNNIGIAFRTFGSGLFLGIGSLLVMLFNGSLFGAIAAHLTNVGSHEPFFTFVVAHGAPELTAIVLAGGAGLRLGLSLLAPGPYSRLDALKLAASDSLPVVYGCFFLLLGAAFIEAFWSPRQFDPVIKYSVGAVSWILVVAYLLLAGRR